MPALSLSVRDHMSSHVVTVPEHQDIREIVDTFTRNNIYCAVVANNIGNLIGFITVSDCLHLAIKTGYHRGWRGTVGEYMSKDVRTVTVDDSIMDVAKKFMADNYRRYPVVDDNRVVGIITRMDVLKAFHKISSAGVAV